MRTVLLVHQGVCCWDKLWNWFDLSLFCQQGSFSSTSSNKQAAWKKSKLKTRSANLLVSWNTWTTPWKAQTIITFNPANVANCRATIWMWPTFGRLLAFLQTSLCETLQAWQHEQEEKKSVGTWQLCRMECYGKTSFKSDGPPPQHRGQGQMSQASWAKGSIAENLVPNRFRWLQDLLIKCSK